MNTWPLKISNVPAVISGVFTFAHTVTPSSPLAGMNIESFSDGQLLVSIAIVGRDAVYHEEVHAVKRYRPSDFVYGRRFADVLMIGDDDRPFVNFDYFDKFVENDIQVMGKSPLLSVTPLAGDDIDGRGRPRTVATTLTFDATESAPLVSYGHLVNWEPEFIPGVVYLCHGGLTTHDREDEPLVATCMFSSILLMVCTQIGLPVKVLMTDLCHKPPWFAKFDKSTTPTMIARMTGEEELLVISESSDVLSWLESTFPDNWARLGAEADLSRFRAPGEEEAPNPWGMIMGCFGSFIGGAPECG